MRLSVAIFTQSAGFFPIVFDGPGKRPRILKRQRCALQIQFEIVQSSFAAIMQHGFQIDFSGWGVKPVRERLLRWAEGFFGDRVWLNDQQLLGWFCEGHTAAGLRRLIHNNLVNWKCEKLKRHNRGWVSVLSADEFRALTGRMPKPVHAANTQMVTDLLGDILSKASKIGFDRVQIRKKVREENLKCCSVVFNALRANTPRVFKRAAEAVQHKITHLRGHLEELSRVRAEHPGKLVFLKVPAWEKESPEECLKWQLERIKREPTTHKGILKAQELAERAILQNLEKELEELDGENGDKKRRRLCEEVQVGQD